MNMIEHLGLANLVVTRRIKLTKDSRTTLASPRLTTYRVKLVGQFKYSISTQAGNSGTFYTHK